MDWLKSKTNLMGVLMILLAGSDIGVNAFAGFHFLLELGVTMSPAELLMAGFTTIFMRQGIAKIGA